MPDKIKHETAPETKERFTRVEADISEIKNRQEDKDIAYRKMMQTHNDKHEKHMQKISEGIQKIHLKLVDTYTKEEMNAMLKDYVPMSMVKIPAIIGGTVIVAITTALINLILK